MNKPRAIVVMGVSGAGKTLIGSLLAERLGWTFADADDYHPPANVEKMRSGRPLDDADREPWLRSLHALLRDAEAPLVLACSALKAAYRDTIRGDLTDVLFVHLHAPYEAIAERLEQREGHYMPASLLESQFNTLELPADALTIDCLLPRGEIVDRVLAAI